MLTNGRIATVLLLLGWSGVAQAQRFVPGGRASANVHVLSHIARGSGYRTGDIEIEQELSRPYAYVASRLDQPGFDILSLKDPAKAFGLYPRRIAHPERATGSGGVQNEYL